MRKLLIGCLTALVVLIIINYIDSLIVDRLNTFNDNSITYKRLEEIKQANIDYDLNRRDILI